ncbi:MAG TPA: hypothetical protein PK983_12250 [Syntrophales bacterium]|nr:hypothetical protein [Syntrophales bacterium]
MIREKNGLKDAAIYIASALLLIIVGLPVAIIRGAIEGIIDELSEWWRLWQ